MVVNIMILVLRKFRQKNHYKKNRKYNGEIVWHPNNSVIFYTSLDANHRPNKIFAHKIGGDPHEDKLIYEEKDAAYFCSPMLSQSKNIFL